MSFFFFSHLDMKFIRCIYSWMAECVYASMIKGYKFSQKKSNFFPLIIPFSWGKAHNIESGSQEMNAKVYYKGKKCALFKHTLAFSCLIKFNSNKQVLPISQTQNIPPFKHVWFKDFISERKHFFMENFLILY